MAHQVTTPAGTKVALTSAEFDLLYALCERPNRVLTRDQLIDLTHGPTAGPFQRSIDVLISRLRQKMESDPKNPRYHSDDPLGGLFVHAAGGARVRRFWRGLRPDHLGGQIAILVLASIVLFHVCVTIAVQFFHYERTFREDRVFHEERAPRPHGASVETAAALAWAFDLAPVDEREQLLATLGDLSRGPRPELAAERPPAAQTARGGALARRFAHASWPGARCSRSAPDGHSVAVALRKGGYLTAHPAAAGNATRGLPRSAARAARRRGAISPAPQPPPPPQSSLAPPPDLPPSTGIWLGSALLFLICAAILTFWTSERRRRAARRARRARPRNSRANSGESELLVGERPAGGARSDALAQPHAGAHLFDDRGALARAGGDQP